jgi:phospholipid transport system substrate-binding protein
LGFYLAFHSQASLAEASPTEQIKVTVDGVLNVLRDKTLDLDTRRSKIRVFINERFYFRAMSQSALARNWRKASPEQQDKFVNLFSQLLENTYLGRIEAYTDERVEYLREKNKSPKRSVVYTQIVTKSGDIPINYKLARKDNKWMVYDVVIEEVSLISNYRSSYAEIIKKEGMDGLLTKMQEKVNGQDKEEKAADALAFASLLVT